MSNFGGQSSKEHFRIDALVKGEKSFKGFSIFSSGGHLVQQSGTDRAILVERMPRNISVKLFQNLYTDLAEEVVKSLFLFIARWPFCST